MKIQLIFILCAVMLLLTFTGCEFPRTTEPTEEPTEPYYTGFTFALEFADGKEVVSGKAQLSQMEVSEALAALEPYGFDIDDCTDAAMAKWEDGNVMSYIAYYEQNIGINDLRGYRPNGDLERAIEMYYEVH